MKTSPIRRNSNPIVAYKRTTFTVILTFALFLWIINPFSASPRQFDRVPFSQGSVEEYVTSLHLTGYVANKAQLLLTFSRISRLWYRITTNIRASDFP